MADKQIDFDIRTGNQERYLPGSNCSNSTASTLGEQVLQGFVPAMRAAANLDYLQIKVDAPPPRQDLSKLIFTN